MKAFYAIRADRKGEDESEREHLHTLIYYPNKKCESFFGYVRIEHDSSILTTFPSRELAQKYIDDMILGNGKSENHISGKIGWPVFDDQVSDLSDFRVEKIGAVND